MNDGIRLSKELIQLERQGRLLLLDGGTIRPLLVAEGADKVKALLEICSRGGSRESILGQFNDPLLLDALLQHGVLKDDSAAPSVPTAAADDHDACVANSKGKSVYLLLTQYCNLRCVYCLNGDASYAKKSRLKMPEPVAFKALEANIAGVAPGGKMEVVFFGGEPLLNWSLAKRIITYCESTLKPVYPDREIKYHLTTNLTLFPSDLIEWAQRYGITFLVDIDGPPEIHNRMRPSRGFDSFARTAAHIKRLAAAGLNPCLRATVTSANVSHIPEVSALHKELGGGASAFVPLTPVNSDELILPASLYPDPDIYAQQLGKLLESGLWDDQDLYPLNVYTHRIRPGQRICLACGAPFGSTPTVDAAGDVYACIYLVGIKRFFLGNVSDLDYPRQDVLQGLRETLDVDADRSCAVCAYRYLCGGGCPVAKLTVRDNPSACPLTLAYAGKIACAVSKTVLDHVLWKMAEGVPNSASITEESHCR